MEHIGTPRGAIWAAEVFSNFLDAIDGGIDFITDQFRDVRPLDHARDSQDVIDYANSIKDRDPGFAADLIAAANRSDN